VDVCSFVAVRIERRTSELALQHHCGALWEGEMVQKASGTGPLVQSEFLQGGETNPSTGRRSEWLGYIGKVNLDEFERRASFEEGRQILNDNCCLWRKGKPCKGGEAKITKIRADTI